MLNKIILANEKYHLFDNTKHITVALSGGADSVALLHALFILKDKFSYSLSAAHLNHSIRGEEADRDEKFAEQFARSLGVEFISKKIDVPHLAKQNKESLELAARNARYRFLGEIAKDKIATAHTASDLVETVIFNMTRGSSLDGICGIPAKRDNVIRPLIFATRSDVEAYLKQNGLSYVTDSTNLDTRYNRNKIRRNVIPTLKEINSAAENNILSLAESLSDDANYLKAQVDRLYNSCKKENHLNTEALKNEHLSLVGRVISRFITEEIGISPDRKHVTSVSELVKKGNGQVSLDRNFFAVQSFGKLSVTKLSDKKTHYFEISDDLSNDSPFKLSIVSLKDIKNTENFNNLLLYRAIDYDKIQGKLVFRSRKDADRISLPKRKVTKSLKKLFIEDKIDKDKRDELLILADEEGILWVEGYGADKKATITSETQRILMIEKIL